MRIVIALGSHALQWSPGSTTTQVQRRNAAVAAQAIAPPAAEHSIVVAHGNGSQVSLLARQAEPGPGPGPYSLDVLDAGAQGMIGYLIQKELRNLLPPQTPVVTLLTRITVDPDDPAFARPSTLVGPVYHRDASDLLAAKKGWTLRRDGTAWRRVVPSPEPQQILEIKPITWLLDHGAMVICAGGGGFPSVHPTSAPGEPVSAEDVIDKDLASETLAEDVGADLFLMATDVDGLYLHWGRHPRDRRRERRHQRAGAGRPESTASGRFRHPHHRRRSGRRSHSAYDMESSIRNSAPPGRGRVNTSAAVA